MGEGALGWGDREGGCNIWDVNKEIRKNKDPQQLKQVLLSSKILLLSSALGQALRELSVPQVPGIYKLSDKHRKVTHRRGMIHLPVNI